MYRAGSVQVESPRCKPGYLLHQFTPFFQTFILFLKLLLLAKPPNSSPEFYFPLLSVSLSKGNTSLLLACLKCDYEQNRQLLIHLEF